MVPQKTGGAGGRGGSAGRGGVDGGGRDANRGFVPPPDEEADEADGLGLKSGGQEYGPTSGFLDKGIIPKG